MDKKLKELERLVSSDPSNHKYVSNLYYYQKRLGKSLSFEEDLENLKDFSRPIYQKIHKFFHNYEHEEIYNEEKEDWGIICQKE